MKKIEKKLKKSAKLLPSMQKEIVFPDGIELLKRIHKNVFYKVAITTLSLGICFCITLSVGAQVGEKVITFLKNATRTESTSTKQSSESYTNSEIIVESTPSKESIPFEKPTPSKNETSSINSSSSNESVTVSDEKTSSDKNSNQEIDIQVSKEVLLSVDSSRVPSNDVGSIIWDGYIYYTNPTTEFPDGLFRQKISGGFEETVTNLSVTDYKVLDGKVYYIHQSNLYSCDVDGSNVEKIYDGVSTFEVAGNWIFSTCRVEGNANQGFYAISTDGSIVKRMGSVGEIHGFNRGYCYITIEYHKRCRIDYRSQNLTQENLKINAEYTYEGSKHYSFIFNAISIRYDYVIQRSGGKSWIVSLKNNTASTLFESQMALPQCRLKDYFAYIPEESTTKNCNIVFVDFNGTKKTFNYDWTDYGHNMYQIYHKQDIHGNSLLMQTCTRNSNGSDVYTLYIVDSDGAITEIYSKTP